MATLIKKLEETSSCTRYQFGSATVAVHGIAGEVTNWKMDRDDPESFQHIADVTPDDIKTIRMPVPTKANAIIAEHTDFTRTIDAPRGVKVLDGIEADGCCIPPEHAFGIVSADCATIVVHNNARLLIAAHAGRDSVVDRDFVSGKPTQRHHFGVVHSAISMASQAGIPLGNLCLGVFGGIRTRLYHDPQHPVYGEFNRKLIAYCSDFPGAVLNDNTGEIDMYAVIRGIAIRLGIPRGQIAFDDIDTGAGEMIDDKPRWASHRHGTKGTRNFMLVSRPALCED